MKHCFILNPALAITGTTTWMSEDTTLMWQPTVSWNKRALFFSTKVSKWSNKVFFYCIDFFCFIAWAKYVSLFVCILFFPLAIFTVFKAPLNFDFRRQKGANLNHFWITFVKKLLIPETASSSGYISMQEQLRRSLLHTGEKHISLS